ncbi:hypothetical protein AAMO2058_000518500 [Amorphochlora amoebiformis]
MTTDGNALLPTRNANRWKSKQGLQTSFLLMSLCFSINHGCVTAVLGLASANLGKELAGIQSGTLYILYTLSALTVATSLVHYLGAKWSLVWGLGLYCAYIASFLVAAKVQSAEWPAAIIGSVIGGTAAGWLWTAQGVYFARVAERYSVASGVSKQIATSWLASVFACCYVGFEVVLKLASSFLYRFGSDTFVYTIFTIVAVACPFLMVFVPAEPPALQPQQNTATVSVLDRLSQAGKLLLTNSKMRWIAGFEIAFGFATSFINFYINGTIVKKALGKDNIGYMTAIIPATATLMSFPYSTFSDKMGKAPVMIVGCISYFLIAVLVSAISKESLTSLGWGLVWIYIVAGNGRAVFEGTNKAMIADLFPEHKPAAFANVIITSGGASAIAFYIFPQMSKIGMGVLSAFFAAEAVLGIICAFRRHEVDLKDGWDALDEVKQQEHEHSVMIDEPVGGQ